MGWAGLARGEMERGDATCRIGRIGQNRIGTVRKDPIVSSSEPSLLINIITTHWPRCVTRSNFSPIARPRSKKPCAASWPIWRRWSRSSRQAASRSCLFGEIDTGKSALINALVGQRGRGRRSRRLDQGSLACRVGRLRLPRARVRAVAGRAARHAGHQRSRRAATRPQMAARRGQPGPT